VVRLTRERNADPYKFLEFLTPDEISQVPKTDPTWLRCNGTRYIMALRRTTKGCHFLDKRSLRCRAYHSRPLLCRLYPFALRETRQGEFKGFDLQKDVECPRHRDDKKEALPLYELYLEDKHHQTDYDDLVTFFNSRKSDNPWDFVKLFVQKD
jgi:Fe-S-cluster containining protein